jgi:hypothetical protein
VISQDGTTLLATMGAGTRSAVVRFSARTGKPQAILTRPVPVGAQFCGVLWSDPRGEHLLTQCGTRQDSIEGDHRTRIHLHQPVPATVTGFTNTFAW